MLKVLLIVSAPVPDRDGKFGVNGPERRSANLAAKWNSKGVEPVICYPHRGRMWPIFKESGAKLIDFEIKNKFNLLAARRLSKIIGENKIQIIHTQGPGSLDAIAVLAGSISKIPVVTTRPIMIDQLFGRSLLRRWVYSRIDKFTQNNVARMVAVSKISETYLREICKVERSKVMLINNGIDLSRFKKVQKHSNRVEVDSSPLILGMTAQLTLMKGWDVFLDVIARLRGDGYNVRGMVLGDGPLREDLKAHSKLLEIEDAVDFIGHANHVHRYLNKMDIFLFTSHHEGLSVAIIEALASSLPIVATDVGGISEQVKEGVNGFICQDNNREALAAACKKLIGDGEMRKAYGMQSRRIAEDCFCEEKMASRYVDCYKEILGERVARK